MSTSEDLPAQLENRRKIMARSRVFKFLADSGQALVEGAFVLLLLFVFIFGIFEAGRMLQVRQALTDAAREGARRSIAPYTQTSTLAPVDDVKTVVKGYLNAASIYISDDQIAVDQNATDPPDTTTIYTEVTVTYHYPVAILKLIGFSTVDLVGKSLMRNETSP